MDFLGSLGHRKRTAAAQAAVAESQLRHAVHRAEARLRDDVDDNAFDVVVFCGKGVAGDVNGFDLRLRRQLAALEAVDADDGVAAGQVLQLPLHFRGIVGQRIHLLARQRRAERAVPIGGRNLVVLRHIHGVEHALQRQYHDVLVVARAHAHVPQQPQLEAGKFRHDRITARHQARNCGDALAGRLNRRNGRGLGRIIEPYDADLCIGDDGAAWVGNRDEQSRVAARRIWSLRMSREGCE